MAWHAEVGLVVIAGCYHLLTLRTYYICVWDFVGVQRMGLGCMDMDMDMDWLDGEGAVGVWMGWEGRGWDGKREWEKGKGKGRRSVIWAAQFTHSLTRSINLSIY